MLAARAKGRTIVGADLSPSYLQQARRNAPSGLYAVADAGCLALRDAAFAASLAQLVLNFVPDPAGAVAEMRRVTRPGGTVAASVWDFRGGLVYQRLFWDTASGIDEGAGRARDRLFATPLATGEGLVRLWTEAGLREIETRADHHPHGLRSGSKTTGSRSSAARDRSAPMSRARRKPPHAGARTRAAGLPAPAAATACDRWPPPRGRCAASSADGYWRRCGFVGVLVHRCLV